MKIPALFMMIALSVGPLMGQTVREIADNLTLPPLEPGAKQLSLPEVPEGVTIAFGGADYEQIIGEGGKISPVISDVSVQVFFKVTKDDETVESKDYEVVVKAPQKPIAGANPKPATIPAILQWYGGQGEVNLGAKTDGITISASKKDAALAQMLANELKTVLNVPVKVKTDGEKGAACIRLICSSREVVPRDVEGGDLRMPSDLGSEGYRLIVREPKSDGTETPTGIVIVAPAPTGLYWGTRTLLQILVHGGGKVPVGTAVDIPRYPVRGCMLDIARTPYTLQELYELVNLMTWYKMNDLHLVINNNYIFHEHYVDAKRDPFKDSYSAFRLESNVKGADGTPLTAQDVSYTKKDFRAFIDYAKARGVNIVPEFDTPGHALSFTRVRPDLIYQGPMSKVKRRCEMLDAANPETLKFVGRVFDEYLQKDKKLGRPVFEGCVVHVGSDEFFGAPEDYRKYTDGILKHVLSRGYTPRVWGSLSAKKGKTPVVSKGVQMNIWSKDWMLPLAAVAQGYQVINTFDRDLYIVPFAGYYRMDRNHKGIYENWLPNKMGPERLPAGHPQLLGATFAVWNDESSILHKGYGMPDIMPILAGSMDVLCSRLWGVQNRAISFDQHRQLAKTLGWGPMLAESAEKLRWSASKLPAKMPVALGNAPIRPPYHLTMNGVKLDKATPGEEQALLSGPEGVLLGVMKDGNIGFRRADGMEFSWDAKLPEGQEVKLELIAELGKTRLLLDGKEVEKMMLNSYGNLHEGFAKRTRNLISTFILPGKTLGSAGRRAAIFRGSIKSVDVSR